MSFFRPARNAVLLLLGILVFAGAAIALIAGGIPGLGFSLRFAAMLCVAVLVALSQFRDSVLAASATLIPLTGVALFFSGDAYLVAPVSTNVVAALVYASGFALALVVGDRFAVSIADGAEPEAHAIAALSDDPRLLAAVLFLGIALPGVMAAVGPPRFFSLSLLLAAANALTALSTWYAMPLAGSLLSGSEDFIVRMNRTRESWLRRLDRIAAVARPPLAQSAAGIAIVLSVLALFGSARIVVRGEGIFLRHDIVAAAAVLLLAALLATRDWRRSVAILLTMAGWALYGVWGYGRAGIALDGSSLLLLGELCVVCFVPVAAIAASASLTARDEEANASVAGILNAGSAASRGLIACVLVLLPWYRDIGSARAGFVLAIIFAGASALVFQPGITGALDHLLPRRRDLAERYRVK